MPASSSSIVTSVSIVRALEDYGEIPIDFLASVVGRSSVEVREYLEALQGQGVVDIKHDNASGDRVKLVPAEKPTR